MTKIFSVVFLFAAVTLFSSCDDSSDVVDVTAPTIEVDEPVEEEEFMANTYMHFEATFTDDIELATYNIEIHDNFNGHAHGRIASTADDPSLSKWMYNQSFEIPAGQTTYNALLEDEILVPQNAMAGPYHFIVSAIDKAGNATSFQDDSTVEIEVMITNDSQPVVTITNLENDELHIEVGTLFMVEGTVSDPTTGEYEGMHGIQIVLGEDHEGEDGHSHGRIAEEDLIEVLLEEADLEQYMVDGSVDLKMVFTDIDFTLSAEQLAELQAEEIDHLLLEISVEDEQGNYTISHTPVHLEE